jgi:hypothetical protein
LLIDEFVKSLIGARQKCKVLKRKATIKSIEKVLLNIAFFIQNHDIELTLRRDLSPVTILLLHLEITNEPFEGIKQIIMVFKQRSLDHRSL